MFLALCLGVGASALNTGNNLLYLIFGTMLSFLILSGLLSNNTLQRLAVRPRFPARIFAGRAVPVRLELENRKRIFPSYALSLNPRGEGFERIGAAFVVKLSAARATHTSASVRFPRRGRVRLPPFSVETAYPFGFVRKGMPVPSEAEAVVYPALVDLGAFRGLERNLGGEFLAGLKGGTAHPYGIRDFSSGDPARLIHWKSSAKIRSWKVKEFEKEKKHKVLLDVRLAPRAESRPLMLERALSAAATLLLLLARRGIEVTLRLDSEVIRPAGRGYLDAYLTALALAEPRSAAAGDGAPDRFHMVATVSDLPRASLSGDLVFGREQLESL